MLIIKNNQEYLLRSVQYGSTGSLIGLQSLYGVVMFVSLDPDKNVQSLWPSSVILSYRKIDRTCVSFYSYPQDQYTGSIPEVTTANFY